LRQLQLFTRLLPHPRSPTDLHPLPLHDALPISLPAFAAGRLLESVGVTHARVLAEVVYVASITVSLAYRAEQIGNRLDGAGFVEIGRAHVTPVTSGSRMPSSA